VRESLDCFVLAGGKSTRFGTNKSLASVGARYMAAVVASNLRSASGSSVSLIGADAQTSSALGLPSVFGSREGNGPLGAIIDALELSDSVFVVIAPNDTPFFSAECFTRLFDCLDASNNDVAVAVDVEDETHVHWLLSVWRKATCLPLLREQYRGGARSVHEAVIGLQIGTVAYESALVRNVNSPEDLGDEGTI
jgi:molybdopterin-guanine dinucleotide biosynthesis protein A